MPGYTEALQASISVATEQLGQEQQQMFNTFAEQEKQTPVTRNGLLANSILAEKNIQQCVRLSSENAANVQVVANTVLAVTGDCGSIFNIINSNDFSTDISIAAKNTYELFSKAAKAAELASQLAMESSMLAAMNTYSALVKALQTSPGKITIADLKTAFAAVQAAVQRSSSKTKDLNEQVHTLAFQFIEAITPVESLSRMIIRKKAINPLIPDELVGLATKVSVDAVKAFTLLLVAVKSTYAVHSAALQSETIAASLLYQLQRLT